MSVIIMPLHNSDATCTESLFHCSGQVGDDNENNNVVNADVDNDGTVGDVDAKIVEGDDADDEGEGDESDYLNMNLLKSSFTKRDKRHSNKMGLHYECHVHRLWFEKELFT